MKLLKATLAAAVVLWSLSVLALPVSAQEPTVEPEPTLVPEVRDGEIDAVPSAVQPGPASAPDSPPDIEVWYGLDQRYGHWGVPQRWVNIMGNAWDADGIASMSYKVNGGGERYLNFGPNGFRLEREGDFNADPDFSALRNGENQITIIARDNKGNQKGKTVTVTYDQGNVWPLPFYIDWSTVDNILDVAQVVDGKWEIKDGQLHVVEPGYDRLVGFGDITWEDYEVVVPITIHQFYHPGKPGAGVLVRWKGHGMDGDQPHHETPFGGLGWYRYYEGARQPPWLAIMGNGGENIDTDKSFNMDINVPYIFKMRVEGGGRSRYYLKVWRASDPEPDRWDLEARGSDVDPDKVSSGSALLVAHRCDASFGNVTITPVQDEYTLSIAYQGQGQVTRTPEGPYSYGQDVTLEPEPVPGWGLVEWSGEDAGDVVNNGDGTWTIEMVKDRSLTATFEQVEYTVSVSVVPNGLGYVTLDPFQATYQYGDTVTLNAVSTTPGYGFLEWSGGLTGTANPTTIPITETKTITATFGEVQYDVYVPLVMR